jgi:hypothetical protein
LHPLGNHVYQLAFRMPGIRPALARFRRQIRQTRNFRYTARTRPQSWQRRTFLLLNLHGRFDLAICAFVAI